MSFIVFFIALIPAVIVVIVAQATGSRVASFLAAVVAGSVGLMTGNPAYAAIDLIFVAVAAWLSWPSGDPEKNAAAALKRAEQKAHYDSPEYKEEEMHWVILIVGLSMGGFLLYEMLPSSRTTKPHPVSPNVHAAPQAARAPVVPLAVAPAQKDRQKPNARSMPTSSKPRPLAKSPFQKCVEIVDEKKMQTCLEKLD